MRVSEFHRYGLAEKRVEHAKSENANSLEEISTQKRIRDISNDPIGMSRAIRYQNRISISDQHLKNMDFSRGFIAKTEASLADLNDNLMRAKELAVAMANDTYSQDSRFATSLEVAEIIKAVVQIANSQYNGRYVFGGFRTTTPPLAGDGTFLGDDGAIYIEVQEGDFKQINLQARYLFEPSLEEQKVGAFGMIRNLETLYEGLVANDKFQIQRALTGLDLQLEKATSNMASLGALSSSLEKTAARTEKERDFTKGSLSGVVDSDAFKATSDFKRTETILQSTLLATNKMLQPSLLNFMQ